MTVRDYCTPAADGSLRSLVLADGEEANVGDTEAGGLGLPLDEEGLIAAAAGLGGLSQSAGGLELGEI